MKKLYIFILLFLVTFTVYFFSSKGEGSNYNYFVLLADAFLHGRLYLLEAPSWLNELLNINNKYYVVYPPMPSVMIAPFVFFFGKEFPQHIASIIFASFNVSLSFLVFSKIFKQKFALIGALLYGFGTIQWFHGQVGSAWYIAHIFAMFFIWLALLETFTKQRLFLVALFIGAAYLSRLPAILSVVFYLFFLHEKFFSIKDRKIYFKNITLFSCGIAIFLVINFLYNFLRFGTINDVSYTMLPVFNEPWYRYGLFHINYIPIHLKEIFTALPHFDQNPPFVIPSMNVLALWFVTPAFLLIPFAKFKEKIFFYCLVTVLIMSLPSLAHGSNGFSQFGFRFALDYHPFLLLLALSGLKEKFSWWAILLVVLSILINLWGVVMITHLNRWVL